MDSNKKSQVREFLIIFVVTFAILQISQYFFTTQIEDKIEALSVMSDDNYPPIEADIVSHDFGPYHITFNSFSGNINSLAIKEFKTTADSEKAIETLFNRQHESQFVEENFIVVDVKNRERKAAELKNFSLVPSESSKSFKTIKSYEGFDVVDTYTLSETNPYAFNRSSELRANSNQTIQLYRVCNLVNTNKALIEGTEQGSRMFQGASFHTEKTKFKKIPFDQFAKTSFSEISNMGWLSFSQRYFATGFSIKSSENAGKFYNLYSKENATCKAGYFSDKIVLTAEQPSHHSEFSFYSGPEQREHLQSFAPNFEYVIDYGRLWFISSTIMTLLEVLNTYVQNWGVSIILMTISLRLSLQLFSFGQANNHKQINAIKKKQQELAKKYGDDQEGLNKALLQFYQDEKINPLSSLFKTIAPLIFQVIMFLAFYSTLMEAVQLRQASFAYINDLSLRDPYFALPVSLVVLAYVQQYLSPKPEDETMLMLARISPLIYGVVALSFPAGLVLYWATNTIYSLVQALYNKNTHNHAIA